MTASEYSLIAIALIAITGCTLRPNLVAAHVSRVDETEIVEVILRSSDAQVIKDREIYFSIVVVDCENSQNRFPVQPYVAEQLASNFDFPVEGEFVAVHGSMPRRILVGYPTPCIALQGGSYIFGKIKSAPIPLVRLTGEGKGGGGN